MGTSLSSGSEGLSDSNKATSTALEVKSGERMKVMRKLTSSGWYFVEKSSDGQKGWIPMSFAKEIIESDHGRAKNYKKRHEFLKYLSTLEDQNNPPLTPLQNPTITLKNPFLHQEAYIHKTAFK